MVITLAVLSFFILGFTVINLFFMSFVTSINSGYYALGALKLVVLMLLVYEIKNEWIREIVLEKDKLLSGKYNIDDLIGIFMVTIGALASFALNNDFGMQAVTASAIVGLVPALVLNKYQVQIYCGSFVGMASGEVFANYPDVILAGFVTGLMFIAAKSIFVGFGGKLGVTAFFGTMIVSAIAGDFPGVQPELSIRVNDWIIFYFIAGALGTYALDEKKKIGVVASSATVGLLGAILLPVLHTNNGGLFSVALFCGSFIGMSSIKRIKRKPYMAIAGVFGAIIFVYTHSMFAGLGGKLGAIAFGSTISMAGLIDLKRKYINIDLSKL